MSDSVVEGAKYGAMYGWARIDHEARVTEHCVKLGAVLLNSAPQIHLTSFATPPRNSHVGFGDKP